MRGEFLHRYKTLQALQHFCRSEPDFIFPVPEEVPFTEDHLLTPFPFFLEAPLINPSLPHEAILKEMLDHPSSLEEEDYEVIQQIMDYDPEALKEEVLFSRLQAAVNQNTQLVVLLGNKLFQLKPLLFKKLLSQFAENIEMNLGSVEVVYKLIKTCRVEQSFLDVYIKNWFDKCKKEEGQSQARNLQLICRMVTQLMEEKLFDPSVSLEVWITFCSQFRTDRFVAAMHKMIEQTLKTKDLK